MATLQAMGVPEDSLLRNPNQIPFPAPSITAQTPPPSGAINEEETTSMRELAEVIDSYAESTDLKATSNSHVDDQLGRNVQPPLAN